MTASRVTAPTIVKQTMLSDIRLFCRGNNKCWVFKFLACMFQLGLLGEHTISTLRSLPVHDISCLQFGESDIIAAFDAIYERLWPKVDIDPRLAPSRGLTLAKFHRWFDIGTKHLELSTPESYIRTLFKFRLGSLPLRCYERSLGDRLQRHCILCDRNIVEDEYHLVFECEAYTSLRREVRWGELFASTQGDLKQFFSFPNPYKVSHFLHYLWTCRKKLILERGVVSQRRPIAGGR